MATIWSGSQLAPGTKTMRGFTSTPRLSCACTGSNQRRPAPSKPRPSHQPSLPAPHPKRDLTLPSGHPMKQRSEFPDSLFKTAVTLPLVDLQSPNETAVWSSRFIIHDNGHPVALTWLVTIRAYGRCFKVAPRLRSASVKER